MAEIQFGVWNIEWMNSLFEGDPPQFKAGGHKGSWAKKKQHRRQQNKRCLWGDQRNGPSCSCSG